MRLQTVRCYSGLLSSFLYSGSFALLVLLGLPGGCHGGCPGCLRQRLLGGSLGASPGLAGGHVSLLLYGSHVCAVAVQASVLSAGRGTPGRRPPWRPPGVTDEGVVVGSDFHYNPLIRSIIPQITVTYC